ncbi:MAG: hypothetical protein RL550_291, partial [Actinomycetota bacterium]
MSLIVRGGRILDANVHADSGRPADLRVADGLITHVVEPGRELPAADQELDASDCVVISGFVDLHVHLREPGR